MSVDIQVVYDKLCSFETAGELAEYFKDLGIRGEQQDSINCPITRFVEMETGLDNVNTDTEYLTTYTPGGREILFKEPHSDAMVNFVHYFDLGRYPDLIEKWECGF